MNDLEKNIKEILFNAILDSKSVKRFSYGRVVSDLKALIEAEKRASVEEQNKNIGLLRQWLNEDRITDPNKMVTNEQLEYWLTLTAEEIR